MQGIIPTFNFHVKEVYKIIIIQNFFNKLSLKSVKGIL